MDDFKLEIKGRYYITFDHDKVMKIKMEYGTEGKTFPLVFFKTNTNEDMQEYIKSLAGSLVKITCKKGYFTKFFKKERWFTEVTCILEEVEQIR